MSNRYYDSCGSSGEIQPGKISAELKAALNIAENDLPIWIYRMRALGYPPGWLKKAVVDTSDIFFTDKESDSKKRKHPSNDEVQYDHSKLIEYPGFNAPMPKGCIDYHYYVNMPAMLEHQQLEYAKKHMNFFKPLQPKKIKTSSSAVDSSNSFDESNNGSPTAINSTPNTSMTRNDSLEDENSNGTSANSTKAKSESNISTHSTSLTEGIKLVSKGSPMPKPVERAPLEKFSEGVVGDLLYFENIPSSTGKFDTIRGLLNTIRRSKSESDTSFEACKQGK